MNTGVPNQNSANNATDDSPWWLKYLVRLIGSVGSIIGLAFGAWACVTLTPRCLMAGILQMLSSVTLGVIEAPCLCAFLDFAQVPSSYFDRKPYWHRGILYIIISILPMVLCSEASTFVGSGLIFVTGSLYGILSLGKKASLDEMKMKASSTANLLASKEEPPAAGPASSGVI